MARYAIFLTLLLFTSIFSSAHASTHVIREGLCVTANVTDISPTSVEIGEEFTVGIALESCGTQVPKQVIFELRDISPHIDVKEATRQQLTDLAYSDSKRFIVYHMKVSEDAIPGTYEFDYRLMYGSDTHTEFVKDGTFSITVMGEEAELSVASAKTKPILPREGETVELTVRIENSGKGTAKSVEVNAAHQYPGIKQAFMGTLEANEDGPAVLTFIADKAGEAKIPITITYSDNFGDHEIDTEVLITILPKDSGASNAILGVVIAAILIVAIYWIVKTLRAKEKIIQQLLSGRSADKKR